MNVYAFDIDETLWISNGPVTLESLIELRNQGNIVGLCGNWAMITQNVLNWHQLFSFINCVPEYWRDGVRADKSDFLSHLRRYVPANDYIMIGNRKGRMNSLGVTTNSADEEAAMRATPPWRFILEDDFAAGVR